MILKFWFIIFMLYISLAVFPGPYPLYSASLTHSPHADKSKLPKGCGSCHKGHGVYRTAMLTETRDKFCFRCHGNPANALKRKQYGELAQNVTLANVQREFEKPYHHPVERTGIHSYGETLPETNPSAPRHSECVDCHHHHYARKENKTAGITGTNGHGIQVDIITSEYELCFKCHSTSANLPPDQTNKAEMFNTQNPSYHPVMGQGKNIDVPSLIYPLTSTSVIKCTDCHGSDNSNGARGLHGSVYKYILKKNFMPNDGPEQISRYELCYSCHKRDTILKNVGFQYHSVHISIVGISCKTCHNPHGSLQNAHLIDFDNLSVTPSSSGRLAFISSGSRAGQCYLTCHGKDHNPASYPATKSTSLTSGSSKTSLRQLLLMH